MPPYAKKGKSYTLTGVQGWRRDAKERERARSERARGRERAIDGGSDPSDDSFARGDKQPPLECSSFFTVYR